MTIPSRSSSGFRVPCSVFRLPTSDFVYPILYCHQALTGTPSGQPSKMRRMERRAATAAERADQFWSKYAPGTRVFVSASPGPGVGVVGGADRDGRTVRVIWPDGQTSAPISVTDVRPL